MLTIEETLRKGRDVFRNSAETELLLSFVLDISSEYIIAHPKAPVPKRAEEKFLRFCKKRAEDFPFAYITNHKEFFGLDFYVDSRVLIPRPETELLVEEALKLSKKFVQPRICDVGTGCGCIAIALAKKQPSARMHASDISKGALAVALKNLKHHQLVRQITLVSGDLLKPHRNHDFDIIVANLPYIPRRETALVEASVKKYEPAQALFGGADGLSVLRRFLKQLKAMRSLPKFVVGEFGFSMKTPVRLLISEISPSARLTFKKDLAKRDRLFIMSL